MLSAGCSRVWILPPLLPHTRVRAGGYLPNSPFCRMGTSLHPLVFHPPFPHPLPPLPSPSPPSHHMLPPLYPALGGSSLSTMRSACVARRPLATPPRLRSHPACGAVRCQPTVRCDAAARHAKRKTIVVRLRPRPRARRCYWTCWGAPCAPPVPPAPPAPTVAPPPLRALLARRGNR